MKTIIQPNFNFYQSANEQGEKIAENFIVRKVEFETVMEDIRSNPLEGSIQHFLFLGRRGSGKSTLLKRIEYEIETDKKLSKQLIPINLAEEQANIYRLSDLWEEIIEELKSRGIIIDTANLDEDDSYEYNRQLYQLIHDALAKNHKKIVLLLDNIDRVFENINEDAAQLREVLLNYKDLKIIGGSTRMSEHFWSYNKPFYNFFRPIRLEGLNSQEIKTLLLHWSEVHEIPTLKDFVESKQGQIETIRIMTDGLPRTLKFFIALIVNRSQKDSYSYLRHILDYVTPLYQERLNHLPAAHRKIVLQLAFIWESTEVKTLAEACKIPSKLISAHLKQLTDNGIVSKIETNKRNHFYKIQERFFNLWLIFTQGSPSDKRKQKCLTIFLENWYDKKEIKDLAIEHLKVLEKKDIDANDVALFSKALVHSKYISIEERDEIIEKTLKLNGLTEELKKGLPNPVSDKIDELLENEEWEKLIELLKTIEQEDGKKESILGYIYDQKNDHLKAERYYLEAIDKGNVSALYNLGIQYDKLEKYELAEKYFLKAAEKGNITAHYNLGIIYTNQSKYELAEKHFLEAMVTGDIKPRNNLGVLYASQQKYELAEKYFLEVIAKGQIETLNNLGILYANQKKYELAEKYFLEAENKGDITAFFNLGVFYHTQEKYELAKHYYLQAISKESINAHYNLGLIYDKEGKYELAEKYYLEAIEKGDLSSAYKLGLLYENQEKYELAEKYYLEAINNGDLAPLYNLGVLYEDQEKYELAEKYYLKAIEEGDINSFNNLGVLYNSQEKYELAEKYFLEAILRNDTNAISGLALSYYQRNVKAETALKLIIEFNSKENSIFGIWLEIIISIWNGVLVNIKDKILIVSSSEDNDVKEFLIMELLIHHQRMMVLTLFEDEKLKEQFIPLYYATLLLGKGLRDEDIPLKIPSELLSTVQDIISLIEERQEFYYPTK